MSLESDLFHHVTADVLVKNHIGTRFYPNALLVSAKGFAYPAATYMRVSTVPVHQSSGRQPLTEVRMQIDVYGQGVSGYADAKAAASAIRVRLEGTRGTVGSTEVRSIRLEDYEDHPDNDLGINEARPFRVRMDFTIWCLES